MTAPEPTPTAEHRDAIARLVWATSRADESTISAIGAQAVTHAILTSTDPAVHAAMLAALVRAGVLTEEQHCAYARAAQADGDYRSYTCEDAGTHCPPPRLVTRWDDALADSVAAMNLYRDESKERRRAAIERVRLQAGDRCAPEGGFVAENALRGRWRLRCATGDLRVEITLAPTTPARVQFLSVTALGRDESLALPAACR